MLGSQYFKQAAQQPPHAPNVFDLLSHTARGVAEGGRVNTRLHSAHETAPVATTNPAMLGIGTLQSILGDFGTLPALALPFVAQPLQRAGIDIMSPIQVGHQGSPRAAAELARISQGMMAEQFAENTQALSRLGGAVGNMAGKLGGLIGMDFDGEGIANWIASRDPQTVGMMYAQFAPLVPELPEAMSALDPSFITDFTPFIKQTQMQNGGQFDEQLFRENVNNFRQSYQRGLFDTPDGTIPAQWAANAVQYTRERLGPSANMAHAQNVARAARSLQSEGLAQTFGGAMELLQNVAPDAAFNPGKARQTAQYLGNMARRGMIDPQALAKAADIAHQQGMDPMTAMSMVARSGMMRQRFGADVADNLLSDTMQTYRGMQEQPWMQALDTATSFDRRYQRRFDQALQRGDVGSIRRLGQQALRDRNVLRLGPGDGASLMGRMERHNPALVEGLMAHELSDAMGRMPSRVRRDLSRTVSDPRRLRQVMSGDFTGVDARAGQILRDNPAVLGSMLSLSPEAANIRNTGIRPQRRIRQPAVQSDPPRLRNLSDVAGYQTPRTPEALDRSKL